MKISGKVQDVWYRASTAGIARDLNLQGYAKNLPNDSVEVLAIGNKEDLEKLKKWCEHGPKHAEVKKVETSWSDAETECESFLVL